MTIPTERARLGQCSPPVKQSVGFGTALSVFSRSGTNPIESVTVTAEFALESSENDGVA